MPHVTGLLTGKALTWAMAVWGKGRENVTNYEQFDTGASYLYQESISFLITDCNKHAVTLGDPNACISWTSRDIES